MTAIDIKSAFISRSSSISSIVDFSFYCSITRMWNIRIYNDILNWFVRICNILYWITDILYWITDILYWITDILYWITDILYWITDILYWITNILCCITDILYWNTNRTTNDKNYADLTILYTYFISSLSFSEPVNNNLIY